MYLSAGLIQPSSRFSFLSVTKHQDLHLPFIPVGKSCKRQGTWIEAEMPGMGTFLKFSHRSLTL